MGVVDHAAGRVRGSRPYQEDDFGLLQFEVEGLSSPALLLVVSDGMGGHYGGAQASALTVRSFLAAFESFGGSIAGALEAGLEASTAAIANRKQEEPPLREMGATLTAAVVCERTLHWISVGDSPLWHYSNGRLQRLNKDHSIRGHVREMVQRGKMTPSEAADYPNPNHLRSVLTGAPPPLVDRSVEPAILSEGDRVLVASDGLLSLTEQTIGLLVDRAGSASDAATALLRAVEARASRGQDNATVAVAFQTTS